MFEPRRAMGWRRVLFRRIALLLALSGFSIARASEYSMLPLQHEGQASVIIDDAARIAYIVDLGKDGDGDRIVIDGLPLLDYLADRRHTEHVVFACSHPHADHMGGIKALFKRMRTSFYKGGDLAQPRFKTIGLVEDAVPPAESLATLYAEFERVAGDTGVTFRREQVVGAGGAPRDAFAALGLPKGDVVVSNVPYPPTLEKGEHGRSLVTLTTLDGNPGTRVLDFDDASSKVIAATVETLKGKVAIDAFVVPHHGSRFHDIEPIFALGPKRAIIAVNPANRFGHPSPLILEALIDRLGAANVVFTGAGTPVGPDGVAIVPDERVVIEPEGRMKARHLASDAFSFPLFVEPGRKRLLEFKATPVNREQIAAVDRIREKMILPGAVAAVPGPRWFDPPGTDAPPTTPPGPEGPAPGGRPGGAASTLVQRVAYRGSALSPGFEAAVVPAGGMSPATLAAARIFPTPGGTSPLIHLDAAVAASAGDLRALAPRQATNVAVRFEEPTGLPSGLRAATVAPVPAAGPVSVSASPLPRRLPAGGMVFLDGGRVTIDGDQAKLVGARLSECAPRACIVTDGGTYRLPFTDMPLFREVLWRVGNGASTFYLSINPRKALLSGGFPMSRVPSDRLRAGTDASAAAAVNDVVTAGGIERSRIGDILWRADVAFKSGALGFDVLGGGAATGDARLNLGDGMNPDDLYDAANVPVEGRWCRLYWHSGAPRFTLSAGDLATSGVAVRASAEAMVPRAGKLVSRPDGTWCGREKRLAASLQRRANAAAAPGVLGELRQLALMQSFALWARDNGIDAAALAANAPDRARIPVWTSGIRTPPRTLVQQERTVVPGFAGQVVHMWSADPAILDRCQLTPWSRHGSEWEKHLTRDARGVWNITSDKAQQWLNDWTAGFAAKMASCGGVGLSPVLTTSAITAPDEKVSSTFGIATHLLSSQLHGGVLLGATDPARPWQSLFASDAVLWAPDRHLLFRRLGRELHFWNLLGTGGPTSADAQHVAISEGELTKVAAVGGRLIFLVKTAADAIVTNEIRARPAGTRGVEWLGAQQALSGDAILAQAVWPGSAQASGALGLATAPMALTELVGQLRDHGGAAPSIVARPLAGDGWLVALDLARLPPIIESMGGAGAADPFSRAVATAGQLARWGFRDRATTVLAAAFATAAPDAEDTLLRDEVAGDLGDAPAARDE